MSDEEQTEIIRPILKRMTKSAEYERAKAAIANKDMSPDYLEIYECNCNAHKGRGIKTRKAFCKGDFITYYHGRRNVTIKENDSYIFEILVGGEREYIDASKADDSFGRLINDNWKLPNVKAVLIWMDNNECIPTFFALRDIVIGEPLEYNYGGKKGQYTWRYATTMCKCHTNTYQNMENDIPSISKDITKTLSPGSGKEHETQLFITNGKQKNSSKKFNEKQVPKVSGLKGQSKHCLKRNTAQMRWPSCKPVRPCPFCLNLKTGLYFHMKTVHKNESEIKVILGSESSDNRIKALVALRRKGLYLFNMKRISNGLDVIPERPQLGKNIVRCSECQKLHDKKYFLLHKRNCKSKAKEIQERKTDKNFQASLAQRDVQFYGILEKLSNDEIGREIKTNQIIQIVAYDIYAKVGNDKGVHTRKTMLTTCKSLTKLWMEVKSILSRKKRSVIEFQDLFNLNYYKFVKMATKKIITKSKYLDFSCGAAFFRDCIEDGCLALISYFEIRGDKELQQDIQYFKNYFKRNWSTIFPSSTTFKNSNKVYCKKASNKIPNQSDFYKLQNFILKEFESLFSTITFLPFNRYKYLQLRRLVVCRLTLFNGRTPDEICLMQIKHWNSAKGTNVLNTDQLATCTEKERYLLSLFKIVYDIGKNPEKQMTILIPKSCWKALDILCDQELRQKVQIAKNNKYVFPSCYHSSMKPVSGHHEIRRCCRYAHLSANIIAGQKYHYIASQFNQIDFSNEIKEFYHNYNDRLSSVINNEKIIKLPKPLQTIFEIAPSFIDTEMGESKMDDPASYDIIESQESRLFDHEDSIHPTKYDQQNKKSDFRKVQLQTQDLNSCDDRDDVKPDIDHDEFLSYFIDYETGSSCQSKSDLQDFKSNVEKRNSFLTTDKDNAKNCDTLQYLKSESSQYTLSINDGHEDYFSCESTISSEVRFDDKNCIKSHGEDKSNLNNFPGSSKNIFDNFKTNSEIDGSSKNELTEEEQDIDILSEKGYAEVLPEEDKHDLEIAGPKKRLRLTLNNPVKLFRYNKSEAVIKGMHPKFILGLDKPLDIKTEDEAISSPQQRSRQAKIKWSKDDRTIIQESFPRFILGHENTFPDEKQIETFLISHPLILPNIQSAEERKSLLKLQLFGMKQATTKRINDILYGNLI